MNPSLSQRLTEVAKLFLKLGLTAFGGPAAHIAMMHDETVKRRKWLSDQEFLDLVGATNLIPGPNSTEMAIHIGFLRAGWRGLIVAGACFIVPAMLIVLLLAWVYVRFGATPQAEWLLYGIKPVVIAIIVQALWKMGQKAVKGPLTAAVAVIVIVLYFVGINEIALLFAGGLIVMFGHELSAVERQGLAVLIIPMAEWAYCRRLPSPLVFPPYSLFSLRLARCCMEADTFCLPSSVPISLCAWAGSLTSNCLTPSPLGRLHPDPYSQRPPSSGLFLAASRVRFSPLLPFFSLRSFSSPFPTH